MKVENGKITECTEAELYDYYLSRGYDDLFEFAEYKAACRRAGTKVTEDEE
ncbi:MAG: hypothetical protein K6E42_08935 [Synergistes sp.]|nr:hypothetical protein [Synergistes sp.]